MASSTGVTTLCWKDKEYQETKFDIFPILFPPVEVSIDREAAKAEVERLAGVHHDRSLWLYPVRGIRRKNIGEMILLSVLGEGQIQFGLTQPPLNPVESEFCEAWRSVVRQLRLPVYFELGSIAGLPFPTILAAADLILTTSVAEGFGMVFLEAFTVEKPLFGRNLPSITTDFIEAGVRFDGLYDEFRIPTDSIFLHDFANRLEALLSQCYRSYAIPLESSVIDGLCKQALENGWIDFGKLPIALQIEVVRTAYRDPGARQKILQSNPLAEKFLSHRSTMRTAEEMEVIQTNARKIRKEFSTTKVGLQLRNLYRELMQATPNSCHATSTRNLLVEDFLDPQNFFPIRFETECAPGEQAHDAGLIRAMLGPLVPIPTEVKPKLENLGDIQVVLFDIYGTLLVSSSGDVGTDDQFKALDHQSSSSRLTEMLAEIGLDWETAELKLREEVIRQHEISQQLGVIFPEVDIVQVWKRLIESLSRATDFGSHANGLGFSKRHVEELALLFELVANPVFPMPHMESTIESLRDKGLKLGIISNAQFYTRHIMEAFFKKSLFEIGFDERLTFFSYCFGKGKPDVFLYDYAAETVKELGLSPNQVLYIGNDVRKDVEPARSIGFRTGLFAGDQRSLRLRQYRPPLPVNLADLILTELTQIDECIPRPT